MDDDEPAAAGAPNKWVGAEAAAPPKPKEPKAKGEGVPPKIPPAGAEADAPDPPRPPNAGGNAVPKPKAGNAPRAEALKLTAGAAAPKPSAIAAAAFEAIEAS